MSTTTALVWLISVPLAASPLVYLAGRLGVRSGSRSAALSGWLALAALAATLVPLAAAARAVMTEGAIAFAFGDIALRFDGVALVLAATVWGLTLVVSFYSMAYVAREKGEEKYYALLLAMAGTMIGLGSAADLFNLWVWFEGMAITSFLLVAFYNDQKNALEAGVKYLVQSAAGSMLVLLGIALVFGETGTVNIAEARAAITGPTPQLLAAGALFLIGFGVKTAIVPMHTWLPDAHSQAPSGISAMLSGVVIEAGLVALLRSLGVLASASHQWGAIVLGFGALGMLVGNLMALRQTEVKRLLAFSSVAHMGYMLLGFGVAVGFGLADGAAGGFFHLMTHAGMKGLAFLAAGALLYALHVAKGSHASLTVEDLNGASTRYPVTAFALTVAVLALGGLPPLAGFMSKWQIFVAGFETRNTVVEVLVIFAAANSVLSLAYYAPLVNRMYRHEPSAAVTAGAPVSAWLGVPLVALTAVVVLVGFWPSLVSGLTGPAAASLVSLFSGLGGVAAP